MRPLLLQYDFSFLKFCMKNVPYTSSLLTVSLSHLFWTVRTLIISCTCTDATKLGKNNDTLNSKDCFFLSKLLPVRKLGISRGIFIFETVVKKRSVDFYPNQEPLLRLGHLFPSIFPWITIESNLYLLLRTMWLRYSSFLFFSIIY